MQPSKQCGICDGFYMNLKQHLRVKHTVPNKQEFCLLMKWGNARTSSPLACPLCFSGAYIRLDKHLADCHKTLSSDRRQSILISAKRSKIEDQIRALRATDPHPPLMSTLGMLDDEPAGSRDTLPPHRPRSKSPGVSSSSGVSSCMCHQAACSATSNSVLLARIERLEQVFIRNGLSLSVSASPPSGSPAKADDCVNPAPPGQEPSTAKPLLEAGWSSADEDERDFVPESQLSRSAPDLVVRLEREATGTTTTTTTTTQPALEPLVSSEQLEPLASSEQLERAGSLSESDDVPLQQFSILIDSSTDGEEQGDDLPTQQQDDDDVEEGHDEQQQQDNDVEEGHDEQQQQDNDVEEDYDEQQQQQQQQDDNDVEEDYDEQQQQQDNDVEEDYDEQQQDNDVEEDYDEHPPQQQHDADADVDDEDPVVRPRFRKHSQKKKRHEEVHEPRYSTPQQSSPKRRLPPFPDLASFYRSPPGQPCEHSHRGPPARPRKRSSDAYPTIDPALLKAAKTTSVKVSSRRSKRSSRVQPLIFHDDLERARHEQVKRRMSRGLTDESEDEEVVESQVTRARVLKGVPMQGSLGHFYESVADDYRSYRLGNKTGRKDRENAQNIARHCLVFCAYMLKEDGDEDHGEHSVGSPAAAGPTNDLTFLSNIKRLRHFPTYLRAKGYAVTSVRNMLISISGFLNHIQHSFMLQSGLSTSDIGRAHYELKKLRSDIGRDIMIRQQQFKKVKTSMLPQASDEVHFLDTAKKRIPQLFDSLISEDNTTVVTEHNLLIGYIMGYLSIISGHRSTVLTEMEASDVMDADSWNNGQLFQLLVGSHKTDLTYGHAFIVLEGFEMTWLQKICRSECCNHGIQPLFVFHTIVGSPVYKANKYLAAAWRDAGLDNPVTFGAIRSSVATQVERHLSFPDRRRVSMAMCHDSSTADKFYVALPSREEAFRLRTLRMKALHIEANTPSADTDTDTDGDTNRAADGQDPTVALVPTRSRRAVASVSHQPVTTTTTTTTTTSAPPAASSRPRVDWSKVVVDSQRPTTSRAPSTRPSRFQRQTLPAPCQDVAAPSERDPGRPTTAGARREPQTTQPRSMTLRTRARAIPTATAPGQPAPQLAALTRSDRAQRPVRGRLDLADFVKVRRLRPSLTRKCQVARWPM